MSDSKGDVETILSVLGKLEDRTCPMQQLTLCGRHLAALSFFKTDEIQNGKKRLFLAREPQSAGSSFILFRHTRYAQEKNIPSKMWYPKDNLKEESPSKPFFF